MRATPDEVTSERAGVFRRLVIVTLAVAVVGLAGAAPWALPERCRWCGWLCAILLVPAGCLVAFQAVRGRADDLREFTAAKFAEGIAAELLGLSCLAAIVALLNCLR